MNRPVAVTTTKREGVLCRWCEYPLIEELIATGLCETCQAWCARAGGVKRAMVFAAKQEQATEQHEREQRQRSYRKRKRKTA